MTFGSVCRKCGIAKKSGKMSCCGPGGSWFGNCGSLGGRQLDHTWQEGLQACSTRRQPGTVIRQQLNAAQHRINDSSEGASAAKSETIITAPKPIAVSRQHFSGAQQEANDFSKHAGTAHSTPGITTAKLLAFTLAPLHTTQPISSPVQSSTNSFREYATLTTRSRPATAIATATISALANTSVVMATTTTSAITSTPMPMRNDYTNMQMSAPAHSPATSQGCERMQGITVSPRILLVSVFFWCQFVRLAEC